MAKEAELMISVQPGDFPSGTRLLADDPEVQEHPRIWVRFAEGDRAVYARRGELTREHEAATEANRIAARETLIKIGARILPSDDAYTEAAKKAVLNSSDLELIRDDLTGGVVGVRQK